MKKPSIKILSTVLVCCLLSACGIGQKKVLFVTKTNVGLDVDAKQFTAQLDIDRQEAVIGPTFEGGKHVPVAAAFQNTNRFLGGFGVSSLFAGGDAALALAKTPTQNEAELLGKGKITLSTKPEFPRGPFKKLYDLITFKDEADIKKEQSLPGPGEVKPFIFDTDTSLGVKLAWTGATGEVPDKIKIGFNREEFALAPVMIGKDNTGDAANPISVGIPSFFAALDTNTEFSSILSAKDGFRQIFAVGDPATYLAGNPKIRAIINKKFELSDAGMCLNKWLTSTSSVDTRDASKRVKAVNDWITDGAHTSKSVEALITNPMEWQEFAAANITNGLCTN